MYSIASLLLPSAGVDYTQQICLNLVGRDFFASSTTRHHVPIHNKYSLAIRNTLVIRNGINSAPTPTC